MTETTATAMPAPLGDDDAFDPIEARLRQNMRPSTCTTSSPRITAT